MKTILTLILEKCGIEDILIIERSLQEIAMMKLNSMPIAVRYEHWPNTKILEMWPDTESEFKFIYFVIHILNDLKLQITNFEFTYSQVIPKSGEIQIDQIQKVVCDFFNVSSELFQSKTRKREVVQARQTAMFFSINLTKSSMAFIGEKLGDKNHATVLYAHKQIINLKDSDKNFRCQLEEIEKRLKAIVLS